MVGDKDKVSDEEDDETDEEDDFGREDDKAKDEDEKEDGNRDEDDKEECQDGIVKECGDDKLNLCFFFAAASPEVPKDEWIFSHKKISLEDL